MRHPKQALLMSLILVLLPVSGCLQSDTSVSENKEEKSTPGVFVTGFDGSPIDIPPLPLVFKFSDVVRMVPNPASESLLAAASFS